MRILLNQSKMIQYYTDFEPVQFKYKLLLENIDDGDKRLDAYLKFHEYETERQFAELTKKEFWDLQENLDMSYANSKITDNYLEIYELMCEKIVRNYIHIDGMERLFSEKYSEFEWEMHLGMDYKKHSMDYYRDHLIHQIRDAYTMEMLLEEGGFYDKIRDILSDEGTSKIAQYVNKMIRQQMRLPRTRLYEEFDPDLQREHYMYNIIHMSGYISGLFHDIGYPAAMALKDSRRMIDYLVEMHHFEQGTYDFRQITSLLQNSLLFRVVSPREIRGRIESDKVDHGTMSALLLLLHFYENGAIHRLEPYKLCAVETAALAIYNHTNKYTYIGDENAEYERAVFMLNPISYLLRISDDIQEWGRIYFEVSNHSNMILCNKCKMPIIRRKKDEDDIDYDVVYQCCCRVEETESLFVPMFRYKQFPYRRIYNITVCDEIEIESYDEYLRYRIRFKYDLDRLLHIAYINPEYARYRVRDLAKVKRLFPRQSGIDRVFLDYFMTANFILIKSVIVGKYIGFLSKKGSLEETIWETGIKDVLAGIKSESLTDNDRNVILDTIIRLVDEVMNKYNADMYDTGELKGLEKNKDMYAGYFRKAFSLYTFIYLLTYAGTEVNTKKYPYRKNLGNEFEKMLESYLTDKNTDLAGFCSEEVKVLLKDCCIQAGRMFDDLESYSYYPDTYFDMYCADDACYSAVRYLTNIDNYHRLIDKNDSELQLDAYTDLYFIKIMLKIPDKP